jgi:hypothetical protein
MADQNPRRGGAGGPKGPAAEPPKTRVDYSQVRVIGDPEKERTDRLIVELQELIRQTRREYDLWFNGTVQKPPHELRNKLDMHVRLLRFKLPKRVADQFRLGTVLQQYQTFAEHWDKSARKQEEGGVAPWMAQSRKNPLDALREENEKRQEEAAKPVKSAYLARITSPDGDEDEMRKVFNSYVAAKKKVGDEVANADFDKFRAVLAKQTRAIIDSGKATAVNYRIEIQDGKVAIKAKGE